MSYATVDEIREYLPQLGDDDETLLQVVLDRATDIVDGELGFSFGVYAETESAKDVWSGAGGRYLYLPCYEIGSIESVSLVSLRGTDDEDTEAEDEYVEEATGWKLYLDDGWLQRRWYRVEAIWGYGLAPEAITQVCLEVAVNMWQGKDSLSATSQGAEGARPYHRSLTWAQKNIIERVRNQYPKPRA